MGDAPFLTAVMEGHYPSEYLEQEGANAPRVQKDDMRAIGSAVDFVGLNIYTPLYVRADDSRFGYSVVPMPDSHPRMASQWLAVGPECAYWGIRNAFDCWSPTRIYVTENGAPSEDVPDAEGRIDDVDRVM
jgi:beta-glucosidase